MEHHNNITPSSPPSPPPSPPPPPRKTYKLTATSISYTKTTTNNSTTSSYTPTFLFKDCTSTLPTYILQDISLTAFPSQILAIVGPSGAGKSTLLDILAARTSPTSGTLFLNSHPISPSSYRKLSAYVPQHDACLSLLTVSETFAFTARLLHPTSTSKEISDVVSTLLGELRLRHLSNTWCTKNLSGGEQRRVSIGLSLLHDPGILLLDEPTSGLDSGSAFNVMQTLKSISISRHRTVVVSIHQPSFKILSTIDQILLLSKGRVLHHGSLCATWLSFGYFVLVIWVIVLMANSFVLFLSSVAPTYIAGTSLVTVILAGFFLFSGYFIGKESMPKYWVYMQYLSMYKYALDALLINEYSCLVTKCLVWYEESKSCMVTGHDVLSALFVGFN
uniref:ABC transporter domain-containing protein n=1 Tax=Chenopodium quinoa TaxID=63459 RepID=A0A803M037_CHEQI